MIGHHPCQIFKYEFLFRARRSLLPLIQNRFLGRKFSDISGFRSDLDQNNWKFQELHESNIFTWIYRNNLANFNNKWVWGGEQNLTTTNRKSVPFLSSVLFHYYFSVCKEIKIHAFNPIFFYHSLTKNCLSAL